MKKDSAKSSAPQGGWPKKLEYAEKSKNVTASKGRG